MVLIGREEGFSGFIIYADESGDHGLGLRSMLSDNPVFVLCFCVFRVADYTSTVVPLIQRLKFRFFGHDTVILHSHEIRKARGEFTFLFDRTKRAEFMETLNSAIEEASFTLIASVINKTKLQEQYAFPDNPYDIALRFCMERAHFFLQSVGQHERLTKVVVERRGKKEDKDLELIFRRVADGDNYMKIRLPFEIVFADKKVNSSGLQIADLVAHPVGRHVLDPARPNHAYEIVERKFPRSPTGQIQGWGLKIFP